MNYDGYTGFEIASPEMHKVFEEIYDYASHGRNMIMFGPSGSGKEYLARYYYEQYKKNWNLTGEFMSLNCAGLSKELARSELFGYEKGSHDGAKADKDGLWINATDGILFLDEIGDIDSEVQAMLLRAFGGEERMVGGRLIKLPKIPVLAATDKSKEELSEPLLNRLGHQITVPGLNDRLKDVDHAMHHFIRKAIAKRRDYKTILAFLINMDESRIDAYNWMNDKNLDLFISDLVSKLSPLIASRDWPGNFRALRTAIDSGLIRAKEMNSVQEFVGDVIKYFEMHVGTYSESAVESSIEAKQSAIDETPEGHNKWSGIINSSYPNVNRVKKSKMISFLSGHEDTKFDSEQFRMFIGDSIKSSQDRLKNLAGQNALTRSGSGTKFIYEVNKEFFNNTSDSDLPSFMPIPAAKVHNLLPGKTAEAMEIVEGGHGLFISADDQVEREAFLIHLGEKLSNKNSVLFFSLRHKSIEEFIQTFIDHLIKSGQVSWFSRSDYKDMTLIEKLIGISGYLHQILNQRKQSILILDGLDTLKSNEAQSIIDKLLYYWHPLRFILGTEKQTYNQNTSNEMELMELSLKNLS